MLEKSKQAEDYYVPLIHGLPDDLALLCLARVPRRFHHVLRCVSRRWGALLSSMEWHSCRQKNNLEEAWIYVMCKDSYGKNFFYVLDPKRHNWKRLHPIPPACIKSWEKDYTDDVYCYDPSAEKWKKASKMPTARGFFLSAAVGDKIYVTTCLGLGSGLKAWDIYDSQSDRWSSDSNPTPVVDLVKSTSFNGKIYTFHKTWDNSRHARAYDLSSRKWKDVHNEIVSCHCGPTVIVDGTLYMLDETSGTRLVMWWKETERWVPLGRLALQVTRPPCQLTAIGRSIFVIGKGLSTVVVDVDMASKAGGALVASSFAPHLGNSFDVVGCKTIGI